MSIYAAEFSELQAQSLSFQNKDWELVCDNTLTCRAAGYHSEESGSFPVSMLIERKAGPNTPARLSIQLGSDGEPPGPINMTVGKIVVAKVTQLKSFEDKQARAVLPALLKNETAIVMADKHVWTLSLQGLRAVLLKMDDFQGRLNTPSALVQRGKRPESSVKRAVAMPIVPTVLPIPAQPGDEALVERIFPSIDREDVMCNIDKEDIDAQGFTVHRLTPRQLLLSFYCLSGAYNQTTFNWLTNDRPPFQPKKIEAEGEFDPAKGTIDHFHKGRGLADCVSTSTWHFTGTDFVLTKKSSDGMCRSFPGGAWGLLRYTALPIKAKKP